MKWSWKIGKFLGVDVYLHTTFFLLIGWIALSYWFRENSLVAVLSGVGFILALFASVVFHEYGHALAARGRRPAGRARSTPRRRGRRRLLPHGGRRRGPPRAREAGLRRGAPVRQRRGEHLGIRDRIDPQVPFGARIVECVARGVDRQAVRFVQAVATQLSSPKEVAAAGQFGDESIVADCGQRIEIAEFGLSIDRATQVNGPCG